MINCHVKRVYKRKVIIICIILCLVSIGRYMHEKSKNSFVEYVECSCYRDVTRYQQKENAKVNTTMLNTTCSDPTALRYFNQNVVAFSFYLPNSYNQQRLDMFIKGIRMNLESIRKYLKGFVMRVYTNVPLNGTYCDIICSNSDIFWCDIRKTPSHGDLSDMNYMTWRFIPLGDPSVNTFLVRDLDSVISKREAMTIKDWLETNKTFHLLRDRQSAHNVAILGGLWGGRNNLLRDKVYELQTGLIKAGKSADRMKGTDQTVLAANLFTPMKHHFVAYDSYHCELWSIRMFVKPFPMQRQDANDFTGNPALGGGTWENQPCPLECRPTYGQNWTYC